MNKKLQVWLPLLFSITMILGMLIGYRMRDSIPGKSYFSIDKPHPLQEILSLVNNKYVDEVKLASLTDTAIAAILSKLDPHSSLISATELQGVNNDLAGNFFGIGVEFSIIEDTINILNVVPNGPSFKAGLQTGDQLIKVNDSLVAGKKITAEKIKKNLRGSNNSKVTLQILRNGSIKNFDITRGFISISSVDASYMMTNEIGYIRLNKFTQITYREFMEALDTLKHRGLKKLIFDLRGNGGGVLDQAAEIADEFLDGDKLITYTEGSHFPKKEYRCKREGLFEKGSLVVLADEGTASASEIVLGALQDWNRGTIIGRRSFGKGLVQEQYDLSDGSALRLTVARYYTPIGRSIQRPYSNGEKAYYNDIVNRFHDGETINKDSVKNDSSKAFKTISGKIVFGNGGITPDVFVPNDTSKYSIELMQLHEKGIFGNFAYRYFIKNKTALKAFKTIEQFAAAFNLTEDDWKQFVNAAKKDSINIENIVPKQHEVIQYRLKTAIARQIWNNSGYYKLANKNDDAISKAMALLQN